MTLLKILIVALSFCFSLPLLADDGIFKTDCNPGGVCTVIEVKTGKILIRHLPSTPAIQPVRDGIFEIKTSCGSPCSASAYYDRRTGKVSEIFPDVLAISPEAKHVIFAGGGKLLYSSVFSSNKMPRELKTKRPLAVTASMVSAIVSVEFVGPTKVKLRYLSGSDFDEVTEVLTLK